MLTALHYPGREQPPWRLYCYRSRPVCVALVPEHHAEFVCGNKFEGFSGFYFFFWRRSVPPNEAT